MHSVSGRHRVRELTSIHPNTPSQLTNCTLPIDNYPQPGKRPLSSIVPTILEDESGDVFAVLGASGGSKIFPAVFQVLANLDWGLDVSAAIEYGRVHDQLFPLSVEVDNVYPRDILAGLRGKGHNITGAC